MSISPVLQGTGAWTVSQPKSERYIFAHCYRHLSRRGGDRGISLTPTSRSAHCSHLVHLVGW